MYILYILYVSAVELQMYKESEDFYSSLTIV